MIYPTKSPDILAEFLKDFVKDKVFCDIGCGEGEFLAKISQYSQYGIGIEIEEERFKIARDNFWGKSNIKFLFNEDFLRRDYLPEADIYYLWVNNYIREVFIQKIKELAKKLPEQKRYLILGYNETEKTKEPYSDLIFNIPIPEAHYRNHEGDYLEVSNFFKIEVLEL